MATYDPPAGPRNSARARRQKDLTSVWSLRRIREAMDLSEAELAAIFGVSEATARHWLRGNPPGPARAARAAGVLELCDFLISRLKPLALPALARRGTSSYYGQNMLALLSYGRERELLAEYRQLFDWAVGA